MRFILLAFAVLPFVIGAGFLVKAFQARQQEGELRRTGTSTTGKVVENQSESRAQGMLYYRPVVEFRTEKGKTVRAVGDSPSRRSYPTGMPIAVVYDPQNPQRMLTGGGAARQYTVAAGVFLVFGVIVALVVREAFSVLGSLP